MSYRSHTMGAYEYSGRYITGTVGTPISDTNA